MPNFSFPFCFYNPLTDQHLDPTNPAAIESDTRVPRGLHLTVHLAKLLIGQTSFEEINRIYTECERLYNVGLGIKVEISTPPKFRRDFWYCDHAEALRVALSVFSSKYPPAEWPLYMGVLALAYAGEIHCVLWPTPEYKLQLHRDQTFPIDYKEISEHAIIASRAVGYGIGFRELLAAEGQRREKNRRNATMAHRPKHAIVEQFIIWSLTSTTEFDFRTTAKAAVYFIEHELTAEQRKIASAASFHETLRKGLNTHCEIHGVTHPFKVQSGKTAN